MEMLLHDFAHYVALAIEAIAIVIIAIGGVEAVIGIVRLSLRSGATNNDRRAVWLTFARWLVAGLTFQLAADVVNTSFAPTWAELGHLAAIAAIRTFLSYFLDHLTRYALMNASSSSLTCPSGWCTGRAARLCTP